MFGERVTIKKALNSARLGVIVEELITFVVTQKEKLQKETTGSAVLTMSQITC